VGQASVTHRRPIAPSATSIGGNALHRDGLLGPLGTARQGARSVKRERSAFFSILRAATTSMVVALAVGCNDTSATSASSTGFSSGSPVLSTTEAPSYGVKIHQPEAPPMIATGDIDEHGRPVQANCATCHATRPPNPKARLGSPLVLFHQGDLGPHGNLTCISCHEPSDGYRSLRLADGSNLPYSEVMQLCAQCHGPQFRDYKHGAHGGMTGYWDLTKGGRERNNCIDCHHPHAPAYPKVRPAAGPQDRFLKGVHHE
jgi:hypothetical protein